MTYSISKNEYQIIQFFQDKAGFQKIDKCAELLGITPSALLQSLFRMKNKRIIQYGVQKSSGLVFVQTNIKIYEAE